MTRGFPGGKKTASGIAFKTTSDERNTIMRIIELLNKKLTYEEAMKLTYACYLCFSKIQTELAKVLKVDGSLSQGEIKYLNLKRYIFGGNDSGFTHFNACCGRAFSTSEYDEYKLCLARSIGMLLHLPDSDLLEYLDGTKDIKSNDEYMKSGYLPLLNGLIYTVTDDQSSAEVVLNNTDAICKILAIYEDTQKYFFSQLKLVQDRLELTSKNLQLEEDIKSYKFESNKNQTSLDKAIKDKDTLNKKLAKVEEEVEKLKAFNKSQEEIIESYKETEKERDEYKNHYFELKAQYDNLLENQRAVLNTVSTVTSEESDASNVEEAEVIVPNNFNENKFLDYFLKVLEKKGLCYDKEDIYNFHVSCKSSNLTILAGASGMGKTRLPLAYAECINVRESDGTLLFLPISPSYTEPSDVLGFYNSQTDEYVPSETGLVDFIKHAQDNPTKMHMVIFDEMNLSQIEYWFAPFMSILEKPKGERIITLYSKTGKECRCGPIKKVLSLRSKRRMNCLPRWKKCRINRSSSARPC